MAKFPVFIYNTNNIPLKPDIEILNINSQLKILISKYKKKTK